MLNPWNIRNPGASPGSDQNSFRCDDLVPYLQAMRVEEATPGRIQDDAGFRSQTKVNLVEPVNFPVFGPDQVRPAEPHGAYVPSITAGVFKILSKMRSVNQQFFWYASANHTGATYPAVFTDSNARVIARGYAGSPHTTGPGTQHEKIKIKLAHVFTSLRFLSGPCGR